MQHVSRTFKEYGRKVNVNKTKPMVKGREIKKSNISERKAEDSKSSSFQAT